MLTLPELSLYISHTCDIACPSCFTYNNLNWGGHFKPDWNELGKLKKNVWVDFIAILGGEPTTNPHLHEWMDLVDDVWEHHRDKWVVTNGRNLNSLPDNWITRDWQLEISAHSPVDLAAIFQWFQDECPHAVMKKYYSDDEDAYTHYQVWLGEVQIAKISESWFFFKESLIAKPGQKLTWDKLYDVETAHKNCIARHCMYFLEGRFYRCARQAMLPQLSKHFQVDGKYKKLAEQDLGCTAEELPEWSKTRLEPQSQCAFCPWAEKIKLPHKSVTKKIKVLQV